VLGRVSQDAQGLAIAASLVGGGTRSEFIASQQQPASIFAVLLAGSLTLAALLGLALLLGRRTTHRSSPLAA
jgi:hypothetical protein